MKTGVSIVSEESPRAYGAGKPDGGDDNTGASEMALAQAEQLAGRAAFYLRTSLRLHGDANGHRGQSDLMLRAALNAFRSVPAPAAALTVDARSDLLRQRAQVLNEIVECLAGESRAIHEALERLQADAPESSGKSAAMTRGL